MLQHLDIKVHNPGLIDITSRIKDIVRDAGVKDGLCTLFIQHTSASLLIQEADEPSAKHDLERWLERLVPEGDPLYTHTTEGPDDMPAHIKSTLTCSSIAVPVQDGALALGRWQGIYLWEHRRSRKVRNLVVHLAA